MLLLLMLFRRQLPIDGKRNQNKPWSKTSCFRKGFEGPTRGWSRRRHSNWWMPTQKTETTRPFCVCGNRNVLTLCIANNGSIDSYLDQADARRDRRTCVACRVFVQYESWILASLSGWSLYVPVGWAFSNSKMYRSVKKKSDNDKKNTRL